MPVGPQAAVPRRRAVGRVEPLPERAAVPLRDRGNAKRRPPGRATAAQVSIRALSYVTGSVCVYSQVAAALRRRSMKNTTAPASSAAEAELIRMIEELPVVGSWPPPPGAGAVGTFGMPSLASK